MTTRRSKRRELKTGLDDTLRPGQSWGWSPTRRQEHLEPTRTGSDFLSRILGSPAFGEADADGVNVDGAGGGKTSLTTAAAVWKLHDLGAVKDVETETRWHPVN